MLLMALRLVFDLTIIFFFLQNPTELLVYLPPVGILGPPIVQGHSNANRLWGAAAVHFFTISIVWCLCLEHQLDARLTRVSPSRKRLLCILGTIFYPQYDYLLACNLTSSRISVVHLAAPSTKLVLGTTPFPDLLPSSLLQQTSFH
jgi:hypothetical protein